MTAIPFHCALEAPVSDFTQWSLSFQFRRFKNQRNIRPRTHFVDGLVQVVSSKMAAVRLYVTLAVLLFATCFHTSEGWWRRRRRSSCSRVNCRWLSWSSWRSCNYYCRWVFHTWSILSIVFKLLYFVNDIVIIHDGLVVATWQP